ncbi:MAG: hypothetical protein QM749_03430 [Aquabacterium sp.]
MPNNFDIVIRGFDKFTPVAEKVRKQFRLMQAPADALNKKSEKLGQTQASAIDHIGLSLERVGKLGRDLATNFSPVAGLASLASAAGIAKFASNWGREGFAASRNARTIGVSPEDLQGLRGAAELTSLEPDAAQSGLASLASNVQGARYGRNDSLRSFMQAKGMQFRYKPDGSIDSMAMLRDVARLMQMQTDPQAANVVAGMFGVQELTPILRDGPGHLDELKEQAKKAGLVRDAQQLEQNEKLNKSFNHLWGSVKGLLGTTLDKHSPDVSSAMDKQTKENEESVSDLHDQMRQQTGGATGSWDAPNPNAKDNYQQGRTPNRWYVPPRSQNSDAIGILQQELRNTTAPDDRAAIARELSRLGAVPQSHQAAPPIAPSPQKVDVEVTFKNAPPGTTATVRTPGSIGVHRSMDGLGGGQ